MILFIPLLRGREERKPELKEQDTGQGERSCLPGLGPGTCDQIQESTSLGNPPPAGKVNGTDGFRAGLVWMGGGQLGWGRTSPQERRRTRQRARCRLESYYFRHLMGTHGERNPRPKPVTGVRVPRIRQSSKNHRIRISRNLLISLPLVPRVISQNYIEQNRSVLSRERIVSGLSLCGQ
jgi:hypothetical protein